MKKSIVFAMMTITTFHFMKANKEKEISDFVLANVEALANNELADNEFYCFGTGSVICPHTGKLVAGYTVKYNIE